MEDVVGSSVPADLQAKSLGLVWGLVAVWRSLSIHQMNQLTLAMASPWRQHHTHWIIIIRLHRSTTYVHAAYCYRRSNVVCLSVCQDCEPYKNRWTDQGAIWVVDAGGAQGTMY